MKSKNDKASTATHVRRWVRIVKPFVDKVVLEAIATGMDPTQFAWERLGIREQPWRRMRADNYAHPGILKKILDETSAKAPELCARLQLQELIDHVFHGGPNPYRSAQMAASLSVSGYRCVISNPPVPEFVGRRAILRRLEEFLFDQEHTVFYLYGGQGIGKSEVVRFLLNHLRTREALKTRFPDGVTLANRHVPGQDLVDLARTMTIILQNLFTYQPLWGDPRVIAGDFARQLYGKRALVAVDNVHGQSEVECLSSWAVKGLGKVILIGMAEIDRRPDWITEELGPFDSAEIHEYLNTFFPEVEDNVLADAGLHGNRPKYLWKSALYHSNPAAYHCQSSQEYFRNFLDKPEERRHIARLAQDDRDSLCGLTVCTTSFDANAARAILNKTQEAVVPYLSRLAGLSWLCRDVEGRFSFHSVERAQLLAVRDEEVERNAYLCYGPFLLSKLSQLEEAFLRGSDNSRQAVLEFNRFRNDLFGAFEYLSDVGRNAEDAATIVRQFISAAPNLLFVAFPYSRHKLWAEAVQEVKGYDSDPLCQYHANWFLNLYAYLDGNFRESTRLALDRVRLANVLGRGDLLVEAMSDLAHAETRRDMEGSAKSAPVNRHFRSAIKLINTVRNSKRLLCHLEFRLGWANMHARHFERAANHFKTALSLADQIGDLYAKGRTLINVSRNLRKQGKLEHALKAGTEAYTFAEQVGSNVLVALSHRNLARIYAAHGDELLALHHEHSWNDFKTNWGHPRSSVLPRHRMQAAMPLSPENIPKVDK